MTDVGSLLALKLRARPLHEVLRQLLHSVTLKDLVIVKPAVQTHDR
jgi:hypothetical protein